MSSFIPGSAAVPSSEVELTISCRGLADLDVFSKSDPMCVTYAKGFGALDWREIHRTECISNTLDPDFASKVHITYHFEEQQSLRFALYDVDTKDPSLHNQDFLGHCETTLGKVVSEGHLSLPLAGPGAKGRVIVSAEELAQCRDELVLKLSARQLDKKDWFGQSDPFYELHKVCEDGSFRLVHRSEVIKWTLNPDWKPVTLPVRALCGGDLDRTVKVVVYDWNRSGNHSLIGEAATSLRQLSESAASFTLSHPRKAAKGGAYRGSGQVLVQRYEIRKLHSFLDYVMGGMQMHCTIAIDFTASNGDPQTPESLHFIGSAAPNRYEQALTSVGEIIQDYDSDKLFPALGFGARLPPDGRVSHEFFLNLGATSPYCQGIAGVVAAYKTCVKSVQLYGPTNFAPVVRHVAQFAEAYADGSQYFVLLILTDGVITDLVQTRQAIIRASRLPMSIIIIGIGNADFTAMDELDADTVPLNAETQPGMETLQTPSLKCENGVTAERDIVQFVPLRQVERCADPRGQLARDVLAEIPAQVVGYMRARGIAPKTRPAV